MDLTAERLAIAARLQTVVLDVGGVQVPLTSVEYVAENITPPAAAVVPSQPYLVTRAPDLTYGEVRARFDVLLVSHREANKTAAALIDQMVSKALAVLDEDYDVTQVSRPDLVTLSGARFLGSVIQLQHDIDAPDAPEES